MNYIAELNAFHDYLQANQLSTSEIVLWHALMHINNSTMWKNEFTASNLMLQQLTGLSISGLAVAKNKLKQRGLIDYSIRKGRQAGKFRVKSLLVEATVKATVEAPVEETWKQRGSNVEETWKQRRSNVEETWKKRGTLININKDININKNINENKEEVEEARAPGIPYQKIVNLYNDLCPKMNRCMKVSGTRERAVKARYSSGYALEDFEKLFRLAGESRFLNGGNERNWRADFDWLVRDANMAKVLEGKYANKEEEKYDGDWYD